MSTHAIQRIDISALFGPPSPARDAADAAIMEAAAGSGFMTISGLEGHIPVGSAVRADLLRLFSLSDDEKRKMLRRTFDPSRPNVYRGFFPLQKGGATYKEGIDMGPDVLRPAAYLADDPLLEPTPLPDENVLPRWRDAVARYYEGMERLGRVLMHSIARGLGLAEDSFDAAFEGGISTLRLIHYPIREADSFEGADESRVYVEHEGQRRYVTGAAHVDSGFVTLLAQDGVEGLQARAVDGTWIDVPPVDGTLAVNFGKLLQRWTGGRIKATEHRVLGAGRTRYSIPFFYEPRVDAVIMPLAQPFGQSAGETFAPVSYGDHLWEAMTKFVEFRGMENLRQPRGPAAAA
jgi:isopenicillin N synthase-like dioxygenase